MAETTTAWPWPDVAAAGDNTTLRWVIRRGNPGQGTFIFINNYQRDGHGTKPSLPPKSQVRLELHVNGTAAPLVIPSAKSDPLTVASDIWAVWPADMDLFEKADASDAPPPALAYATAQLVARVRTSGSTEVLFLLETQGTALELAFTNGGAMKPEPGKASVTTLGNHAVFRDVVAGTQPFVVIEAGGAKLSVVVLPWSMADCFWLQTLGGVERLMVAESATAPDILLLSDNHTLHLRTSVLSDTATQDILICPAPTGGLKAAGGAAVASKASGVFESYSPPITKVTLAAPTITRIKTAGPPRNVTAVRASNHLAREPTMEEWHAAEVYNITLKADIPTTGGDYKLAIDYLGDSARLYFGDRCLTDNVSTHSTRRSQEGF